MRLNWSPLDPKVIRGLCRVLRGPVRVTLAQEKVSESKMVKASQEVLGSSKGGRSDILEKGFLERGFSEEASACMAVPNRGSTEVIYQGKWNKFSLWCKERKVDPSSASLCIVADFLLFLRNSEKLSLSAIQGYCAAISPVLKLSGVDVSSSQEIGALLRNFKQQIPRRNIKAPMWDISLILQKLKGVPFEPLERSSLTHITWKTVFLVALASSKRVGDIQAFSFRYSHTKSWLSVSLSTVPEFVAKTLCPGVSEVVSIPALSSILSSDDEDNLLCPVRALREYSRRTVECRPLCSRLFVSITDPKRNVSKTTISRWIRSVILFAYKSSSREDLKLAKVKAHEVRAVATSLLFKKNLALSEVMQAASWRCNSTFASHYLREIAHVSLDLHSLGPVVAAQNIV